MIHRQLAAAAVLLFFCAAEARAQQGHAIRGKVRDAAGNGMPRIIVDLQTGTGLPVGQTTTNNEGDFYFSGLTASGYIVFVNTPDFQPASETVQFSQSVSDTQPGELRTVELTLTPKPGVPVLRPGRVSIAQNVPPAARAAFERGIKFSREKQPQAAVTSLREAVRLFPDYFDAHFALGAELEKAGDLTGAIAEFERARQINPKDDAVYSAFGAVMIRQHKFGVAAAVYAEAARLSPRDPQYPFLRGMVLVDHALTLGPATRERKEALGEAETALRRAFELSGRRLSAVHRELARVYERLGERARAADELEKYLRANPGMKNAAAIREAIKTLRTPAANPAPAPSNQMP